MGRHRNETGSVESRQARYQNRFEFRHAAPKKGKRKLKSPLWARLCVVFGTVLMLLSSTAYAGKWFLTHRYENNIERADLLGNNRRSGADAKIEGPLNFLIIGSDSREGEKYNPKDPSSAQASVEGERADTIILAHTDASMKNVYIISIPRDTYVRIPPKEGVTRGEMNKINASYYYGGAPLLITTVQNLLDININYPIIANFKALRELTDAVGGIEVVIDRQVTDRRSKRTFKAGVNHLNGKEAEDYVRQRYDLPEYDFDRQKRQQQFLFALLKKISNTGITSSPSKMDKLLRIATENLTVDNSMRVSDIAFNMKNMRPGNAKFMTLPMARVSTASYAELVDEQGVNELSEALQNDAMDQYVLTHDTNDVTHGS